MANVNNEVITITEKDLEESSELNLMTPPSNENSLLSNWKPGEQPIAGKQSVDIILCLDTSGSMDAADYPPTRLDAAKEAALMFTKRKVTQNYNDRVGVIGFGGTATVIHPLDENFDAVAASVSKLSITHTSTSLGIALQTAFQELSRFNSPHRAVVLLSDGGDEFDNSNPEKVVGSQKGIKVFTIGMGTIKGAHVKFLGKSVSLNEDVLRRIAKVSGGEYLYAPNVTDLQRIYLKLADY